PTSSAAIHTGWTRKWNYTPRWRKDTCLLGKEVHHQDTKTPSFAFVWVSWVLGGGYLGNHGDNSEALRRRHRAVLRQRHRVVRAPSALRLCGSSARGAGARTIRGRRPYRARSTRAALAQDPGDVRPRQSEVRVLPVDGVPHRSLADQQHHQPR